MSQIIECIPNFSTSDPTVLASIVSDITSVPEVMLLDSSSDTSHNRSVITFAGSPEAVCEAAFQSIKTAANLINLNHHKGEHPRMGATDVCPFVPISGITLQEAADLARQLGQRVGNELNIPVYLYEHSALRPDRANLANIRRGGYEKIQSEISTDPDRTPDFGPSKLGPAGCVAIGARNPLIAFNINLATSDVSIAKAIAKKIRESSGGLPKVKALGLLISSKKDGKRHTQVSMNLTDYSITPPLKVFKAIEKEAKRHGVTIIGSEIIGLIPQKAIPENPKVTLHLHQFSKRQILEHQLSKAHS